jgi:hypothetical protein
MRWAFCRDTPWEKTKQLLKCAGSLSQAGSISSISGGRVPRFLGGNAFGDVVGGLFGDDPGGENSDQGAAASGEFAVGGIGDLQI